MLEVRLDLRLLDFQGGMPILPGVEQSPLLIPLCFGLVQFTSKLFESAGVFDDGRIERVLLLDEVAPDRIQRFDSRARLLLLVSCLPDLHLSFARATLEIRGLLAERCQLARYSRPTFLKNGQLSFEAAQISPRAVGCDTQLL